MLTLHEYENFPYLIHTNNSTNENTFYLNYLLFNKFSIIKSTNFVMNYMNFIGLKTVHIT